MNDHHQKNLRRIILTAFLFVTAFSAIAQEANFSAGITPSNDLYTNAEVIKVNEQGKKGILQNSSIQDEEPIGCMTSAQGSVWFKFIATGSKHFVEIEKTNTSPAQLISAIWNGLATWDASSLSALSCESEADGRTLNVHTMDKLDAGNTYYIQVACSGGGNSSPEFSIFVGIPSAPAGCSNTAGTITSFNSEPSVTEAASKCSKYSLQPRLNKGHWKTSCFNLTASHHTLGMRMIINAVGGLSGNVSDFHWTIEEAGCQTIVASGNMSNLTANGLTEGKSYTVCYSWQASCQQNFVYPYVVYAEATPVELITLYAEQEHGRIRLKWTTASETGNDRFEVERSSDGITFKTLQSVSGAGNNNGFLNYAFYDEKPLPGKAYYRLKQAGPGGTFTFSKKVAAGGIKKEDVVTIMPNSKGPEMHVRFYALKEGLLIMRVADMKGETVLSKPISVSFSGLNVFSFPSGDLKTGEYTVYLMRQDKTLTSRFSKN